MNADAFRQLFGYHFSQNRKLWDEYISGLTWEQFTRAEGYSHGSLRDQLVHMASVDEAWFCELRGAQPSAPFGPPSQDDRPVLRAWWDGVEQDMLATLADLRDGDLLSRRISEPEEDRGLAVWQVLIQVVNHGTDHRAQVLRQLHDLGLQTTAQDYIFYAYDHL